MEYRRCGGDVARGLRPAARLCPVPVALLEDSDNLPVPGVLAAEILEELQSALAPLWLSARSWRKGRTPERKGVS